MADLLIFNTPPWKESIMISLFKKIYNRIENSIFKYVSNKSHKRFYSQFIGENDIVFDIGANHGNRSTVFSKICKKVIAVEPNPVLAEKLSRKFTKNVIVVSKAVGSMSGEIDLFINKSDVLSTISPEWIAKVKETERFGTLSDSFTKKVKVNMVTLNELIKEYGIPAFVKIDVEGVEFDIIKTMDSVCVKGLSCEFTIPESSKNTFSIVTHLKEIGYNYFNISFGESMEFLTHNSMSFECLIKIMKTLPDTSWGDIYAFSEQK
jgi:FkbM family methyltransferase